jgi:ATP-binding cassette, subfamily B, bacterial
LALARVFLTHPDVLILDEATSNLDIQTERQVIHNLLASRSGLSTVLISHRPETLTYASRVYELIDGRLATHSCAAVYHHDGEELRTHLPEISQGACK